MTDTTSPAEPAPVARARALRRTLLTGGVLLIVGAVATFAVSTLLSSPLYPLSYWLGTAAFLAALLVFAFGIGRAGSIVARRPLAVVAAVIVAVWPLVDRLLTIAVPYAPGSEEFSLMWGYLAIAVKLGALIVFVVQIARAGVVTGRIRWLPLWGLVAIVAPQVIAQVLVAALGVNLGTSENDGIWLIIGVGQLFAFAVPVALGITAVVVANRPLPVERTDIPVQVYPPAA